MKLTPSLQAAYSKEQKTALESLRLAHEISFGPIVFQVSRLMVKWGLFQMIADEKEGVTLETLVAKTGRTRYAIQLLLESSLTIGTLFCKEDHFFLSKVGWFLLHDPLIRVNTEFNHDVNYQGWFHLEEALIEGTPAGLKTLGDWSTIYEGLSSLPEKVQESWLSFDHYYSDNAFDEALAIVFASSPKSLLDVGGNTGRWALRCVAYDPSVKVTIMDLPQQLAMMREQVAGCTGSDRIEGYGANLLDDQQPFPIGHEAIWMSQFLDCFSEEQVTSILTRASAAMDHETTLYIMETFWDRQQYVTAAYCLTQISLYFTALANGNSKMYHSDDMARCIEQAGLRIEKVYDMLGKGHSIVACKKVR